jgi:hypothetical protein
MQQAVQPNKQAVRDYMQERARQKAPPPSIEEVRRMLGFGFTASSKDLPQR